MSAGFDTSVLVQSAAILVVLGGALLFYFHFRARYLLLWALGWLVYLSHTLVALAWAEPGARAYCAAAFFIAIYLFGSGILLYSGWSRMQRPLALTAALGATVAAVQVLWYPGDPWVQLLVHGVFVGLVTIPGVVLMRHTSGRGFGPAYVVAVVLLIIHWDLLRFESHKFNLVDVSAVILLTLSMLLLVIQDFHGRTRRLEVLGVITRSIADAWELRPMLELALGELRTLTGAGASWVRLLQGTELELSAVVGLNKEFVAERSRVPLAGSLSEQVIKADYPAEFAISADDPRLATLQQGNFRSIVLVPLRGRHEIIGTLFLGFASVRRSTPGEFDFLNMIGNHLGLAAENLRLDQEIRHSRDRWVATFDAMPDGMFVHDQANILQQGNRAFFSRLGRVMNDVMQRPLSEVFPGHPQQCPYCQPSTPAGAAIPDPWLGGYSLVSTSTSEVASGQASIVHVVRDVSEHRKTEERYQLLFEGIQEAVFVSTPEGRLLDCNEALVRMFGYGSKEEMLNVDLSQLYESPAARQMTGELLNEQGYLRDYEVRLRRRDGTPIIVLESSFATRSASGTVESCQGVLLDITEKKRAEEELRRRNRELFIMNAIAVTANQSFDLEELLSMALRHLVELFSADTGSVYLFQESERRLHRVSSVGQRSKFGRQVPDMEIPPEFWERIRQLRLELITPQHLAQIPELAHRYVSEEGLQSWIWVVLWNQDRAIGVLGVSSRSARQFSDTDRALVLAVGRQLASTIEKVRLYEETRRAYDDLRRTQEQLLQSEKMSAVGQLISGVAHELNNPLTAILGYSQLLEGENLEPAAKDFVHKLYRQALRTQKIVQNLLSFARQRKPQRQLVNLASVLKDTISLRDYDMQLSNIEVHTEFESQLPPVVGDEHQLEQVFLNILNNSMDAMLEKANSGRLFIELRRDGDSVIVSFRDSGPGIQDVKRVFDPFYTTKGVGKGTGLGLSICYGIIKEHGGEIRAFNHPEGGAVFEIRLPAASAEANPELHPPTARLQSFSGRVLVVDDEESVLDFESRALAAAGAEVLCASSGEQALSILQNEPNLDVLVVDGKMPGGWSAQKLHAWLQANRPSLAARFILAHSNPHDPVLHNFLARTGIPSLTKPFEASLLVETVALVLLRKQTGHVTAGK